MKILIAAFTLAAMTASAEVVIYNQNMKDAAIGAGDVKNRTYAGWLVLDTTTYEVREILARKLNKPNTPKTFMEFGTTTNHILWGAANKYALWVPLPIYDGAASFKGILVSMTVGTPNQVMAPKTMTVTGSVFESDIETLHEFSGTLTINKGASVSANQQGKDLNAVVSELENSLLAKGYVQF